MQQRDHHYCCQFLNHFQLHKLVTLIFVIQFLGFYLQIWKTYQEMISQKHGIMGSSSRKTSHHNHPQIKSSFKLKFQPFFHHNHSYSQQWRDSLYSEKKNDDRSIKKFNLMISQEQSFKRNWSRIQEETCGHLSFIMMIPQACSEEGKRMLENGNFLLLWIKTLQSSKFINIKVIADLAYKKFSKGLSINREIFLDYCSVLSSSVMTYPQIKQQIEIETERDRKNIKRDQSESNLMGSQSHLFSSQQSIAQKGMWQSTTGVNWFAKRQAAKI